jgi:hypothetical protein
MPTLRGLGFEYTHSPSPLLRGDVTSRRSLHLSQYALQNGLDRCVTMSSDQVIELALQQKMSKAVDH